MIPCPECRVKEARIRALVAETTRQLAHAHRERMRARTATGYWQEMLQQRDALLAEVRALRETLYLMQEEPGRAQALATAALTAVPPEPVGSPGSGDPDALEGHLRPPGGGGLTRSGGLS